jgi:hypothetical protein
MSEIPHNKMNFLRYSPLQGARFHERGQGGRNLPMGGKRTSLHIWGIASLREFGRVYRRDPSACAESEKAKG